MAGNSRVFELLEEMLDSGATPEEVCRDCPELLAEVRRRWATFNRIDAELAALLPPSTAATLDAAALQRMSPSAELPQVPGYRIDGLLGQGGMGIVYRAWHLRLNRAVALKMLLVGPYARPDERERFLREAQAVATLRHPNIVQVYDAGEVDGRGYFTMELVEGGDLAHQTRGVPQPARRAADLVATLAGAIQLAHENGIVHRDLKPNNILLTKDGIAKVTDFGLARRIEGDSGLTFSGVQLGTPNYMAPEQALGHKNSIGPATDVYALGAMLYELLTGRPPFRAETPTATLKQVVDAEPVSPVRLNPQVPRDLATICLKCLHKEPHKRYASAQALGEDLARFGAGEAIRARPVGPLERTVRWIRRRPTLAAALASGVLLASALIGTVLWWYAQRTALEATAVAYAEMDLSESERLRDKGEFKASAAVLQRAKDRLREFVPSELRDRLTTELANLELVTRLDAIRLERALVTPPTELLGVISLPMNESSKAGSEMPSSQHYKEAFDEARIGTPGDDPSLTGAIIQRSPVRAALVSALDDWAACSFDRHEQAWILKVVQRADPDPWRDRVRDPLTWDNAKALVDLAAQATATDQSPHLLAVLGARLRAKKSDAVPFMRRVVSAWPADFWANIEMGNALFDQGNSVEAVGYYRAALALRPNTISIHYALGGMYLGMQHWDQAVAEFEQAVRLDPENPWCHNRLGFTLAWKGQDDDAIIQFRESIRVDPDLGWSHYFLAIALEKKGCLDEAVDEFEECRRLLPEKRTEAKQRLRKLLLQLRRTSELCAAWKEELVAHPPAHEDWFGYAELCLFLGDEAEYGRARRELLAQFGAATDLAVCERTGRACLLLPAPASELEQAVGLVDRAVAAARVRPQFAYPYCLFAQGLARYRQGRFDDAIKLMSGEAASVMGPSPRLILAMAQYQKDLKDQANQSLATAISSYDWTTSKADNHDAWIAHILRREAESMFRVNAPPAR